MAYSKNNLMLIAQGIGGGQQLWAYRSTEAHTAVDASGYVSNGADMGVVRANAVLVTDTTTGAITQTFHTFNAVSSTDTDMTNGLAFESSDTD